MLRRGLFETRAFLCQLHGRGWPEGRAPAAAAPPLRHFLERLLSGAAPISRAPSASSVGGRSGGDDPASLTVHFLRSSCGLAEADAAAAASRIRLRSTRNARRVLALLRGTLDLPPASVARLVAACPSVLSSTTLNAKLGFYLHELGLSPAEVNRFLLASPNRLLNTGLDTRLRPNLLLLRDLLGTDEKVLAAIKQSMELIYDNLEVALLPKVKVLRDHGVPEEVLVKLVMMHPRALVHRSARFDEGLVAMKDLGVDPDSGIFPYAFGVFAKMFQSKWNRRMENYLSLGWTEQQVRTAFVRHPYCMSASDGKVRQIMQFLSEKLGWSPQHVSSCPTILSLSYEKRLLPRYKVLSILVSQGVINSIRMSHLTMPQKKFVEKYVTRFQDPQVLEAYGARTATAMK